MEVGKMFNNFNLSDDDVLQIIKEHMDWINANSLIGNKIDEDLKQMIILDIYITLTKNRENFQLFVPFNKKLEIKWAKGVDEICF